MYYAPPPRDGDDGDDDDDGAAPSEPHGAVGSAGRAFRPEVAWPTFENRWL